MQGNNKDVNLPVEGNDNHNNHCSQDYDLERLRVLRDKRRLRRRRLDELNPARTFEWPSVPMFRE